MSYPKITRDEIENWFTYHAPTEDQVELYNKLRSAGRNLAHIINQISPESQEKWQAIFELRSVIMWANAALACNRREETNTPGVPT